MAKFVLAGGGTAGHVNPLLATAEELINRGHDVAVVGTAEGLEAELVPRAGLPMHVIPRVPFPRRPSASALRFPWRLRAAVRAASRAIDEVGADAVVGFGGYVSTPAYLAARKRGVPVVVHEGNAKPGLANRLGARNAAAVAVTFKDTPLPGAIHTGLPLRYAITDLAARLNDPIAGPDTRRISRATWGWPDDAPTLLVTGGSTGAASLNAAVAESIETLVAHGIHVLHLTGRGKSDGAQRAWGNLPAAMRDQYVVREYVHDMDAAFAAADAVVCRAGAGMVCEVTALGIPAVYVPLPHGNGEQALNAREAVEAGAATLLDDADLTPTSLELRAEPLVLDRKVQEQARAAAASVGVVDGAARLATLVEGAIT